MIVPPKKARSMDGESILESESIRKATAECAGGVCVVTVGSGLESRGVLDLGIRRVPVCARCAEPQQCNH
jgi:hypothetical protein